MTKNTGKSYEKLAQNVFNQILNQESVKNISVQHDVILAGKTASHQIDVYWEFELGGIKYVTIVQAKDWANSVDQGELLKFKAILDDLPGQARGVFVTRTDYQSGAKEFAKANGIKLYVMRPPAEEDWEGKIKIIDIKIHILTPVYSRTTFTFDFEWLKNEKVKLGLKEDETLGISIKNQTGQLELFNEDNIKIGIAADAMKKLKPTGEVDGEAHKNIFTFNEATFIKTELESFPRLKVNTLETWVTEHVEIREIKIDASEVIGLILKDILSGNEFNFDHDINLRNKIKE